MNGVTAQALIDLSGNFLCGQKILGISKFFGRSFGVSGEVE